MALPVALQLYSVRNEMEKDFSGTLLKVKEMGYQGVELAGLYGKSASEMKKALDEVGLIPVSAHVSLKEILADPQAVLGNYASLGIKYIAIPYLPEEDRPAAGNFQKTLANIRFVCEQASSQGLTVLYHNHDFEFDIVDGEYYLDTIFKTIPENLLQTEIDTCWVNVAGEDPASYVKKYSGRAPIVHLKDFTMNGRTKNGSPYELIGIEGSQKPQKDDSFSFRPVGSGVQEVPKLLQAALDAGTSWVVVEQDRPADGQTELQSAELSRSYLKELGW